MEPIKKTNAGSALVAAISIGGVLLLLAISLLTFVSNQNAGINAIVNGEAAHFIAEAAISRSIVSVRNSLAEVFANNGNSKLYELMTKTELPDTNITGYLNDNWNQDLKAFVKEVDETASVDVAVWLRDFKQTETEKTRWLDPIAKRGFVVIEATGKYKNGKRTISVRRSIDVVSVLPDPMTKFTLFVKDSGAANKYNVMKNDYNGSIVAGAKPLIVYNHAVPDSPEKINQSDEKSPDVWIKRGWLWLGGTTRLNLCSGAGEMGEVFHFYDVSRPNAFSPISFNTPKDMLPPAFSNGMTLPWDKSKERVRTVNYTFSHGFVLDGFHYKSTMQATDAMYEGGILSESDKKHYGSKSSVLHLYGDARPGYNSRTKIFGNVYSAFIRFANLDIKTEEQDVAEMFKSARPKPIYLLKSLAPREYNDGLTISEVRGRAVGGPMLKMGMLFNGYGEYSQLMSGIVEQPYITAYNSMQEILDGKTHRNFPPDKNVLEQSELVPIALKGAGGIEFDGMPSGELAISVLEDRANAEVGSISEFWDSFLNEKKELELNCVVRIRNENNEIFKIPPEIVRPPLKVKGGGAIVLEQGSAEFGGVDCDTLKEALTVAVKGSGNVRFNSISQNQVNIIAPGCELSYSARIDMLGSLCVRSISVDDRFQGGRIIFRQGTDPVQRLSNAFYKIYLSPRDSYWNG